MDGVDALTSQGCIGLGWKCSAWSKGSIKADHGLSEFSTQAQGGA